MKQTGHLAIDGHEAPVVTVGREGVGTVNGILIALQGLRGLAHVAVGTAQKIVGTHLLVGGAVVVVVVGSLKQQRVEAAGHGHIGTVQAVGPVEQCRHLLTPPRAAQQQRNDRQDIYKTLHDCKDNKYCGNNKEKEKKKKCPHFLSEGISAHRGTVPL